MLSISNLTFKQLDSQRKEPTKEIKTLSPGTSEYSQRPKEIHQTISRLSDIRESFTRQ